MRVDQIARRGVARTFQGTHLFAGQTVVENILVGRHVHMKTNILQAFCYFPWVSREEDEHRRTVEEIIDFLEIESIRNERVGTLGYGLRKRVDLGRALAQEPSILLMDEPMAGMNSEEKEDLARFILDVREARKTPVVLVEHDMGVVMDLADRIVVLDFGRVIADGTPAEVQRNPDVIRAYLGESAMTIEQAQTLAQVLAERARLSPDAVCERHKRLGVWHEFTWAQVHDNVRALALGLQGLGLRRGGVVMAIGENEPEHFWAEFAAHALGAAVVSLYPDQNADEIAYLAQDSGATVIVAQDQEQVDKALAVVPQAPAVKAIVYWDAAGLWSYRDPLLHPFEDVQRSGRDVHAGDPACYERELAAGCADDVAVLSYTSGTTGRPKGVILTQRYLFDNAARITGALDFRPGCEYLTYIAPAWATEQFFGITLGLMLPMVVNFPERPEQVLANLRELAVEAMLFSPRQWESLASVVQARMLDAGPLRRAVYEWGVARRSRGQRRAARGRQAVAGGAADVSAGRRAGARAAARQAGPGSCRDRACAAGRRWRPTSSGSSTRWACTCATSYGATEIGLLTLHQGETVRPRDGGPLDEVRARGMGRRCSGRVSGEGELLVKGGSGFAGYHGKPDKTAEAMDGELVPHRRRGVADRGGASWSSSSGSRTCGGCAAATVSRRSSSRPDCASARSSRT